MKHTFIFAGKFLKEAFRNRFYIFFLIFPLMFIIFFGLTFGRAEVKRTFNLATIDHDNTNLSKEFIKLVENSTYEDSDIKIFNIKAYDDMSAAKDGFKTGMIDAILEIPSDFSDDLNSYEAVNVTIHGDPASIDFFTIQGAISGVSYQFTITRGYTTIQGATIAVNTHSLGVPRKEFTYFDFVAPGMMVMGTLVLIPHASQLIAKERERFALRRLLTTKVSLSSIIAGAIASMIAISSMQQAVLVISMHLIGFESAGNVFTSYLYAFLTVLLCAFGCIGISLIIFHNEDEGGC